MLGLVAAELETSTHASKANDTFVEDKDMRYESLCESSLQRLTKDVIKDSNSALTPYLKTTSRFSLKGDKFFYLGPFIAS